MKTNIIWLLIVIAALLVAGSASAQSIDTATVVVSGGNAVVVSIPKVSSPNERIVSRSVGNASNYTQIGTLKRPETFAAFRAIAGDTVIQGLKKMKKLSSDKDLWKFIQSNPSYKDFSFAMVSLKFLRAIGWAYIDNTLKDQPKGTKLFYKVVDQATSSADTGSCITGRQPSERQPLLVAKHNTDSVIYLRWGYKTFSRSFLPRYAYVYEKTIKGIFEKQPYIAYATYSADSVYYGLSQHVKPNREFTYYIQPVDFFNNAMNIRSDTVSIISVNFKRIPPVKSVAANDTTNGILLSWKKQNKNLFLTAILIERSTTANGVYSKIAERALADSTYLDQDVKGGQTYYYRLKVTGQNEDAAHRNNFSAFASANHSDKHNKPDAPYQLSAEQNARGVKLTWQGVKSNSLAGYYVFRSTGADTLHMELISRLINTTTFTDTTNNLSRRLNYIYAVKSVNLADIKSNYSATVQAKLPNGIDKPLTPAFINVVRSNYKLLVEWQNTALTDNYISGYVLYKHKIQPGEHITYDVNKKASTEAARLGFQKVSAKPLKYPSYEVTATENGGQYEYAVAAVDVLGGESGLSALAISPAVSKPLMAPLKLVLRNMNSKVQLEWMQADTTGLTGYSIYRKAIGEKEFKKIANVANRQSNYTDSQVQSQKIYFYKVKAVSSKGESSGFASSLLKVN